MARNLEQNSLSKLGTNFRAYYASKAQALKATSQAMNKERFLPKDVILRGRSRASLLKYAAPAGNRFTKLDMVEMEA